MTSRWTVYKNRLAWHLWGRIPRFPVFSPLFSPPPTPDGRERKQAAEAWTLPIDTADGPVRHEVARWQTAGGQPGDGLPDVVENRLPIRVFLQDQVLQLSLRPESIFGARLTPFKGFVCAGELLVKAKAFDDGLLAAVDLASQERTGSFHGKRPLLRALVERLPCHGSAASVIAAACDLAGIRPAETPEAARLLRMFLADEKRNLPIGFYTWTPELMRVFRQDRMTQTDLSEAEDLEPLVTVLTTAPELRTSYTQCLRLAERTANPLDCADLRPWITAMGGGLPPPSIDRTAPFRPRLALFPPSRSHESDVAKRLYGSRWIPGGAQLLTEVISAVRSGSVALAPGAESGWSDWQTWALEPLVATDRAEEASRLVVTPSYRDHLEVLFRAALALVRETHIQQLAVAEYGCCVPPVLVQPALHVEPLTTHYGRRAQSYRFIRDVLVEAFGESALDSLHRIRRDGPVEEPLASELDFMIGLFEGAANIARLELGKSTSGETGPFVRWATTRDQDPDVGADLRMMVPVYYDRGRRKIKVWMFLGWVAQWLDVSFVHPPRAVGPDGQPVDAVFKDKCYPIATPVIVEALVSRLLDQDAFRGLCDRHRTPRAVLRAVQ